MPTSAPQRPVHGLTDDEVLALMARVGIVPAADMPASDDPATVAAAKARQRYAKRGKPLSQYMTDASHRLGQLFLEFSVVKPQADDLKERAEDLSKSIKSDLSAQNPNVSHTVQLYCAGRDDGLAMIPYPKTKINWDALKAARPDIVAVLAQFTETETEWRLTRIKNR